MAKDSAGMLVLSVSWRNSEYFCASSKIQYRNILLLKKKKYFYVLLELQVNKSSALIGGICKHRIYEYACLQEHPCCFKRHK